MRKTILTILSASVIAALMVQTVCASEYRHTRKTDGAPASQPFRNTNAYAVPAYAALQHEWSHYNGGISAPAGR
jgi:hypothetical protein